MIRLLATVLLLAIAWWVGASGLYSMDDLGQTIESAREKISE